MSEQSLAIKKMRDLLEMNVTGAVDNSLVEKHATLVQRQAADYKQLVYLHRSA